QRIPNQLDGHQCEIAGFNINSHILFECRQGPGRALYALWDGGDSLKPLPSPVGNQDYQLFKLADDGTIAGNTFQWENFSQDSAGNLDSGSGQELRGFIISADGTHFLDDANLRLSAMSDDGKYQLASGQGGQNTLLHELAPIALAPTPAN